MHAPSARTFGPALAGCCCSGATTGSGADSAGAAGVGVVALRGRLLSFLSVSSLGGSTVAALRFLFLTVAAGDDGGALEAYYGHMAHVAAEFSANIVVVLGGERAAELGRRLWGGRRTTLGEPVQVVGLDPTIGGQQDPIALRDAAFLQAVRERAIREYFFGDARNTLSPYTQQVEFDALSIWKVNSGMVFFPSFHFSLELYSYTSRLICLSSCTGIYAYTCICNADAA